MQFYCLALHVELYLQKSLRVTTRRLVEVPSKTPTTKKRQPRWIVSYT